MRVFATTHAAWKLQRQAAHICTTPPNKALHDLIWEGNGLQTTFPDFFEEPVQVITLFGVLKL